MALYATAGEMNQLLVIEEDTTGLDNTRGQTTTNWVERGKAWAKVEQLSGGKATFAQQQYPTATHQIKIWFRRDLEILTGWQFKSKDREYEIVAPPENTDQRNIQLVCFCAERVKTKAA